MIDHQLLVSSADRTVAKDGYYILDVAGGERSILHLSIHKMSLARPMLRVNQKAVGRCSDVGCIKQPASRGACTSYSYMYTCTANSVLSPVLVLPGFT